MKTSTVTKALLLLILLLPSLAAAGLGELRLSHIEGDVQIRTDDTGEWTPAVINFPLQDGDQLWVPEYGRAAVESRRGTIIRLDERTALDVLTVENDALQFYLGMGLAYVNVKDGRDSTLQMDTPNASIRVYEPAKFSADVANNGETDLSVFEGAISAENRQGETMVEAGKILSLANDGAYLSPLSSVDEWERWNKDQDRIIEQRRESARYLPEELAWYSSDFDNNGEWVDMPSYGHVWRPTAQNTADWSPYRDGRWVWMGDDYVWIAHESWGWAPYHYGRWSFVAGYGWCWVPPARHEAHWGPGYVGWVHTPTYVAWVPLAPEEVYYGRGNYGPHSVDTLHIDVNKVVIINAYKNVHVKNSVTTVSNETFLRGKRSNFTINENPFLKKKISVGRPRLKPERATRIASAREISKAMEPPDRVRGTKVDVLKKQRRLVTKRDKSVFLPERAPKTMAVRGEDDPKAKGFRKVQLKEEAPSPIVPHTKKEVQSSQGERKSRAPAAVPPPESKRETKQNHQSRREEKQSGRDAGDSPTKNRWSTQAKSQEQEARPVPAGREPPQPERAATPPPESRRETKQNPQSRREEKQSERDAGESPTKNRWSTQAKSQEQEARPVPAGRESSRPERAATPTPESRRETRQNPQSRREEKQSDRAQGGGQRNNQLLPQSKPPSKKVQPAPAETKEAVKDEEASSVSGHKKKKKKQEPTEPEEAPDGKFSR